jgi:hypothetical protein
MCTVSSTGISGQAVVAKNSPAQGQCSRCHIAIYPGMLCGIENGKLVCRSQMRAEKRLSEALPYQQIFQILQGLSQEGLGEAA